MLFQTSVLNELFKDKNIVKDIAIDQVVTDSRLETNNSLFIPIIGERFNGHAYLQAAIDNGAIATLWQRNERLPNDIPADFIVYFVEDTIEALQLLAKTYLQNVNPKVIGITGSNGKTTTKDLVYAVVKQKYRTHRTKGNFNNHIGLPLTILDMPIHTEVVILEMGMDKPGEIDLLASIAQPDIAIITNIGESHIENFADRAGIANAKLEIINYFSTDNQLIVDGDEPLLGKIRNTGTTHCGFHHSNDVTISHIHVDEQATRFTVQSNEDYTIPLIGRHHAKNATYALVIGKKLGLTQEEIQAGFHDLEQTGMRFEFITGKNGVQLINDAYNASPTSMKAAIDIVKQLPHASKKIIVLGDILELGDFSEQFHRSIASVIEAPIDIVYTYGSQARFITEQIKENNSEIQCEYFSNKEDLTRQLQCHLQKDTLVLFKASRGMAFETLVRACMEENKSS